MRKFLVYLIRALPWLVILIAFIILFFAYFKTKNWFKWGTTAKTEVSTHQMVVQQIEELGKLELVKFRIKDVVEHTLHRAWYRGGDTRVLLVVGGEAVGCIDLRKIASSDVTTLDSGSIIILLPQPEICYSKINHNESHVYDTKANIFYGSAEALDSAYRRAEGQIEKAALQQGILKQTQENALKLLTPLLTRMSGKRVVLVFKAKKEAN
ncbi:MAG: DUF4230 domain-containing protein [Bacteroidota bacterium]|nr:DUF4230 domain-containing protein [Bacteroidota bacterium]